jgi:hypothetical protein
MLMIQVARPIIIMLATTHPPPDSTMAAFMASMDPVLVPLMPPLPPLPPLPRFPLPFLLEASSYTPSPIMQNRGPLPEGRKTRIR